jgi:hypothetical protein
MPIVVQRHNIHFMMFKHNLYNRKTPKSYISSLLFGSFQAFGWLQTFAMNFQVQTQNLAPTSSWLCICRCSRLLQYQFPSYNSPHVTPQHALDLKKEKCLVAKIEIGRICTNLNVIHLNCYILCSALQRLQLSLTTSKKNLKMWGQLLSNTYNKTHHAHHVHHCLFSNTSKKA